MTRGQRDKELMRLSLSDPKFSIDLYAEGWVDCRDIIQKNFWKSRFGRIIRKTPFSYYFSKMFYVECMPSDKELM